MQLAFDIDDPAAQKLACGDDRAAEQTFFDKRHTGAFFVDAVEQRKAKAAGEQHGPVRPAAPEDLDQTVGDPSENGERTVAFEVLHCITVLSIPQKQWDMTAQPSGYRRKKSPAKQVGAGCFSAFC